MAAITTNQNKPRTWVSIRSDREEQAQRGRERKSALAQALYWRKLSDKKTSAIETSLCSTWVHYYNELDFASCHKAINKVVWGLVKNEEWPTIAQCMFILLFHIGDENIHFRTLPLDHYTIDEDRQEYASDFEDVSSGFLDVAAEDPEYTRIMKAVRPYLLELMDKDFCLSSYMFDQELISLMTYYCASNHGIIPAILL